MDNVRLVYIRGWGGYFWRIAPPWRDGYRPNVTYRFAGARL